MQRRRARAETLTKVVSLTSRAIPCCASSIRLTCRLCAPWSLSMKLLAPPADIAQWLSKFITKGGWIAAPLGGALLLYLLQDKLVFNPVRSPPTAFRLGLAHRMRPVTLTMADNTRLHGWWMRPN